MQAAINQANERAMDPDNDPNEILRDLERAMVREFHGWYIIADMRLPLDPEHLYRQVSQDIRDEIRILLTAPHFIIRHRWYVMDPPMTPEDDLWGSTREELRNYTRRRVEQDREVRSCEDCWFGNECNRHVGWPLPLLPGRAARVLLEEEQWFAKILLLLRGQRHLAD